MPVVSHADHTGHAERHGRGEKENYGSLNKRNGFFADDRRFFAEYGSDPPKNVTKQNVPKQMCLNNMCLNE